MKEAFKNYFSISKKEWNGMVVLLLVIVCVAMLPYIGLWFKQKTTIDVSQYDKAIVQLNQNQVSAGFTNEGDSTGDVKPAHPVMFVFNPNNLAVAQWQKLGLSKNQALSIKNYEAKGGHFYSKGDVQKMYALQPADYLRLAPFIDLPKGTPKEKKTSEPIEINSADSATLTLLKGIGPVFALRIIKYREQLGGFYKAEQLKEVYGFDSLKFNGIASQIKVDRRLITKINLNKINIDDFRKFPYLNFKQMNAIIAYRAQHGNYHQVTDLSNIVLLNDEILRKIAPYLSFK